MNSTETISEQYVATSFGKIFCRSIGQSKDPLFLIVHGSGSSSGSHDYAYMLHEFSVRFLPQWSLFMVALDCPGYGKSEGTKQTIRSYPGKFLKEFVVKITGKSGAFVLMGHSQGGCAVFNATLEDPGFAEVLVQDRPVFGDIKKLKALKVPTLLVYDVEDDGHPIKQGKQIAKEMPKNRLITYKGSEKPYWHSDNLFDTILQFMKDFGIKILTTKRVEELVKVEVDKKGELLGITNVSTKPIGLNEEEKAAEGVVYKTVIAEERKLDCDLSEPAQPLEKPFTTHSTSLDTTCPICLELLWKPVKLPCNHYGCAECLKFSIIYNPKCPICRTSLQLSEKDIDRNIDTSMENLIVEIVAPEIIDQRKLKHAETIKNAQPGIKVEYGNYSTPIGQAASRTKQKYSWKLFVKVISTPIAHPISEVEFDINPGMKGARPVKVSKEPFELERTGGYEFGCEIRVNWKKALKIKEYVVPHTVTLGPEKTSRQFIQYLKKQQLRYLRIAYTRTINKDKHRTHPYSIHTIHNINQTQFKYARTTTASSSTSSYCLLYYPL
eukprot:TRINITY_DN95_c0_g1_i1.p3 TRINITY_DN95_c0_g1~~TRINITY_DN95_c0_g1_i1.p3  ORF type:complete len:552 (-),score=38.10 TRINITY_DN95_c0_g1_i1:5869-7524(-)